jgi:RNA-binding protein YhbY
MYPSSGQLTQGLETHATQLRADKTGQMLKSLEDSLEEASSTIAALTREGCTEDVARQLDSALDAAKVILVHARKVSAR